jgi:DHA1 family bicyclomycin/chloramphenicol resistance-like MFS transporter
MGPLTTDMYLPAFPALAAGLRVEPASIQVTLTAMLVGQAVGQLMAGPLSDAFGRRRPLLIGLLGHALASVACALAPNVPVLVGARLAQGLAGAALSVITMAVVRDLFSGSAAARLLSRLMLVVGLAPVVAPSIGSAILAVATWRWIFVALAATAVALVVAAAIGLPETLPAERRRSAHPVATARTYRELLRDRPFVALCLVGGLVFGYLFAYISGSPFVLQGTYGLSQQAYGIVFGLNAIGMVIGTQLNPLLLERFSPARILSGAVAGCAVAGAVLVAVTAIGWGGLAGAAVPLWFGLGACGLCFPNAPALALTRHGEAAGTAAALLGAAQFGVGGLAAPLVGALGGSSPVALGAVMCGAALAALALLPIALRRAPTTTG